MELKAKLKKLRLKPEVLLATCLLLLLTALGQAGAARPDREIVFIDRAVSDYQQLVAGVKAGTECVVLDPSRDELAQMAATLKGQTGLSAIHLVSHGAPGEIVLGANRLTETNLAGQAARFRAIGQALAPDGDLLVYGCNVAQGSTGQRFVNDLARATGADVAASTNPTGTAILGGDWALEYQTSTVKTAVDLGKTTGFTGLLAQQTIDLSTVTVTSGSLSSGEFIIGGILKFKVTPIGSVNVTQTSQGLCFQETTATNDFMVDITDPGTNGDFHFVSATGNNQSTGGYYTYEGGASNEGFMSFSIFYIKDGKNYSTTAGAGRGLYTVDLSTYSPACYQFSISDPEFPDNVDKSITYPVASKIYLKTLTVDMSASLPKVTSIIRSNPTTSLTNADSLTWQVTFSEDVKNVDTTDFTVSGTTATVTGVTKVNDSVYNVTVSGGDLPALEGKRVSLGFASGENITGLTTNIPLASTMPTTTNDNYYDISNCTLPTLTATGSNPSFTEGGSAVDLFGNITAKTNDSGQTFNRMTLTVSNVSNGDSEILSIGGTNVKLNDGNTGTITGSDYYSVDLSGGTATVTLTGMALTDAQMGTLLDGLTYRNASEDPGASSRVVTITGITDSGITNNNSSPNITSTVTVTPVNDAPTLSVTGGTPTYNENGSAVSLFSGAAINPVEAGQTITNLSLSVSNVTDGSSEILNADGTNIALTNGGTGTTATNSMSYIVNVASGTATVILSKATGISSSAAQTLINGIKYSNISEAPTTSSTRTVTLSSITDSGGTINGGVNTTTLSSSSTVSVVALNDAPTLSGGPFSFAGTNEDTTSSSTLVSTLLAGLTYGDPDTGALSGIAVTASTSNGTWQYSTDGSTWNTIGTVSGSAALLISASTQIRYVPDGQNGETPALTFRAWDQTAGTASTNSTRNIIDTTTNGGTTAFSTGTVQASITVNPVNDAPVLTPVAPVLTGIIDSAVNNSGQTVTNIVGSSINDVDNGALEGIAVTSLVSGTGKWQYSLDSGSNWSDIGSVSASNALLLHVTDKIRLVPDGVTGTTASFTYRAWDQTGTTAGKQGTKVDSSVNGSSTPFSTATDTASITVTAVNDAPVITASGGSASFAAGDNIASTPVAVDNGITVSDSDNNTLASATVSISGNFHSGEDVLAFSNNNATTFGNISASYNAATGVLTLTDPTATVAQWQAALRATTYTDTAVTPNIATRTVSFTVDDGNATSTATRTVTVTATDQTPIVTTMGGTTNYVRGTAATTIDSGITVSDLDNTTQSSATVSIGAGFSVGDVLGFTNTSAIAFGNIVGSYNATTGVLTLTSSGVTATNAQWANALSTVKFSSTSTTYGNRTISFATNDGTKTSAAVTDTVNVNPPNPMVTSVSSSTSNGTHKVGDTIDVNVTFDQTVTVSGSKPTLLLETGNIDRSATYTGGSGTNTLSFSYTVQAGDQSADLDYAGTAALTLNGITIRNGDSLDAVLTLPAVGSANSLGGQKNIVIDGVAPTVNSVTVPATGIYMAGQNLDFTVNFSEPVTVTGTPDLGLTLNTGGTVQASYLSGTGSSALIFRYTVMSSGFDPDGISLSNAITCKTGVALADSAGNSAVLTLNVIGSTLGIRVDGAAPVVTLGGGSSSFTENSGPIPIDTALTVSANNTTLAGATVTITGNYKSSEDSLIFNNDGSTMGNITGSYDNTTGILTLSGATATVAQWQSALRAVTYKNSSEDPNTGARTISFVVNDGVLDSSAVTKSVGITPVNDAPNLTVTPTNPTYREAGSAVALFGNAAINAVESGQSITKLSLMVGNLADGANETLTVDGTSVPLTSGKSGTTGSNTVGYTVTVNGTTATVTLTKTDTAAKWQSLINGLTYQDSAVGAGLTSGARTVALTSIGDDGGTANDGVDTTTYSTLTSTVTVNRINHAPTLTADSYNVQYTEGGLAALLFLNTKVGSGSGDTGQLIKSLTLTVSNVSDGADEILTIDGTNVALTDQNTPTTVTNGFNVAVSGTGTTKTLVITKTGNYTTDQAQSLIDGLRYSNRSDEPTTTQNRVITVTALQDDGGTDGGGKDTAALSVIDETNVIATNDPPTLNATATDPTYTEGSSAVGLFSGASISTVESGQNITKLTLTVGNLADGAKETLTVDGTSMPLTSGTSGTTTGGNKVGYTVAVSGATATVTLTKTDTVAHWQSLIDGLAYRDTSANLTAGTRTVTLTSVTDSGGTNIFGGADIASLSIISEVKVVAVNDAPVIKTSVGTAAFNGGAGASVIVDNALTISDVDSATLATATITVSGNYQSVADTLSFANNSSTMGNIAASWNAGTGTLTLTSAGATATLDQWQAAVRAVKFANTSHNLSTATRTVSFTVNDGSLSSAVETKQISVTPCTVATLAGLSPSVGDLSPAFAAGVTSYTVSVTNPTGSFTLTPTVTDSTATVTVNGTVVASRSASALITLNVGDNAIPIKVTAQDGTTTTIYTVMVKRAVATTYTAPAPSGSALGSGSITASFNGSGTTVNSSYFHSEFVPTANVTATAPQSDVAIYYGLFRFTTTGVTAGSTLTFTITYPQTLPTGTRYWKYGPTSDNHTSHWYVLPADISGNKVTFSITDGGLGDDDLTVNGSITDDGGVGGSTVPGAPTSVSAVAGDGQATVSFTAPVDNGGAAITDYTVTAWNGSAAVASQNGNKSPITMTGLTNGTAYTFTVTAANSFGPGAESTASNSVTPYRKATINSFEELYITGNILTVVLDSTAYKKIVILNLKGSSETLYTQEPITKRNMTFGLTQEPGRYQIVVQLYDQNNNHFDKVIIYNVRVKYVPGKGDGFGWEMWKN